MNDKALFRLHRDQDKPKLELTVSCSTKPHQIGVEICSEQFLCERKKASLCEAIRMSQLFVIPIVTLVFLTSFFLIFWMCAGFPDFLLFFPDSWVGNPCVARCGGISAF